MWALTCTGTRCGAGMEVSVELADWLEYADVSAGVYRGALLNPTSVTRAMP